MYPTASGEPAKQRRELTPETVATFQASSRKTFAEGALSVKVKQRIAVAVARVTQ